MSFTNYLLVTDPVGTLRTQSERVLYKKDLGLDTSDLFLMAELENYIAQFVTIAVGLERSVQIENDWPTYEWKKRLTIKNSEGELIGQRDIQIIVEEVEEV